MYSDIVTYYEEVWNPPAKKVKGGQAKIEA
jgi:hypothetical protein